MNTVSFTGHRPDKFGSYDESIPLIVSVKAALAATIIDLIAKGYTKFICGGALGVDTWAAEIVIELKRTHSNIVLVIARPFPSQSAMWPNEAKIRFQNMCSLADEVYDVSPNPYAAWKMQRRNQWMADNSDVLVAVFDGSNGGTANCVKYATLKLKTILVIDPKKLR
jgi:uncharacterized phage-like protein YoqJ